MLLAVLWALPALGLTTDVVKCCPEGRSLDPESGCRPSSRTLLYGNVTHLQPDCGLPLRMVATAERGARVACIDALFGSDSVAALVCDDPGFEGFPVPSVNGFRKCCPLDRKYHSVEQSCWSDKAVWERRDLQALFNAVLWGFDGMLDVGTGTPECPAGWVVVDYLVPGKDVKRQSSESVKIVVPGHREEMVFNPDESCVDLTEKENVLVVRACRYANITCGVGGKSCVRKCCPDGQDIDMSGCYDSFGPDALPEFYKIEKDSETPVQVTVDSPAIAFGFECPAGKYLLEPEEYVLLQNGDLFLIAYNVVVGLNSYCFESTNGTDEIGVFVCFPEEDPEDGLDIRFILISIGLIISCTFLFITFAVYASLPTLHNLHGKNLMCHVISLFAAYVCLVVIQLESQFLIHINSACFFMGFAMQFTFLAAFGWLNVICFDIWWTFGTIRSHVGRRSRERRRFYMYNLYAWGLPTVFTGTAAAVQFSGMFPEDFQPLQSGKSCWFSGHGYIVFFIAPQSTIIASNIVFFILTARNCSKVKNEINRFKLSASDERRFKADMNKLVMNVKLFLVMGVSWALEIVSIFVSPVPEIWYLTDTANCLQGVLIFCIFVLKRTVLRALQNRYGAFKWCSKKEPKGHRPSTSTLFTGVATDSLIPHPFPLTKSLSDLRGSRISKTNRLTLSTSDLRLPK